MSLSLIRTLTRPKRILLNNKKCKDLIRLGQEETYLSHGEEYVITENHTVVDVLHWLVSQSYYEERHTLLNELEREDE